MPVFICEACNETLKKNKVDEHSWKCRGCWILSCMDCNKRFEGEAYKEHTTCVTEAERYQGHLYVPKDNKGEVKQQAWLDIMQAKLDTASGSEKLRPFMERLMQYDNVPRKKAKFINFAKNSLNLKSDRDGIAEKLWDVIGLETSGAAAGASVDSSTGTAICPPCASAGSAGAVAAEQPAVAAAASGGTQAAEEAAGGLAKADGSAVKKDKDKRDKKGKKDKKDKKKDKGDKEQKREQEPKDTGETSAKEAKGGVKPEKEAVEAKSENAVKLKKEKRKRSGEEEAAGKGGAPGTKKRKEGDAAEGDEAVAAGTAGAAASGEKQMGRMRKVALPEGEPKPIKWKKIITKELETCGGRMNIKDLRKVCVAEVRAHPTHSDRKPKQVGDEFDEQLRTFHKFSVNGNQVILNGDEETEKARSGGGR